MKKFWRITYILYRNAVIRDLKISISIITGALNHLMDGVVSIALIFIVYTKTDAIGGWNIYETLILISSMKIITTIFSSWLKKGTGLFAEHMVRTGEYDFYLTKPFDPMIAVSISKPRIYNLINIPFYVYIFIYAINHLGRSIPPVNIACFFLLFICAFLLFYALRLITVIPAFWIIKSYELVSITDRLQNVMKYPADIYPRTMAILLSTLLPIFAISYLPVKVLLFEPRLEYIIYTILITGLFLLLARLFWKFGEKHYGSASS